MTRETVATSARRLLTLLESERATDEAINNAAIILAHDLERWRSVGNKQRGAKK